MTPERTHTALKTGFLFEVGSAQSRRYDTRHVAFDGFDEQSKRWVKSVIDRIGLPTDTVTSVTYRPNDEGRETVLAQAFWETGELRIRKSLSGRPEIYQLSAIAHEIAHFTSPWKEGNQHLYGESDVDSAIEIMHAREHSFAVADQSIVTRKFLSGYHKSLFRQLENAEISPARFIEETQAIMTQERINNPAHLRQVQESQRVKLERMRENGLTSREYTQITATNDDLMFSFGDPIGIDRTMIALMNVNKSQFKAFELNSHIESVRASFSREKGPLE